MSYKKTILKSLALGAELTTLDTSIIEVQWLHELLMDLMVVQKYTPTISMNYDNQTIIIKVNNSRDSLKSTTQKRR
jgi:hypothetical protein